MLETRQKSKTVLRDLHFRTISDYQQDPVIHNHNIR